MNLATDVSARLTTRIVKVIMSTGRLTTRIVKVITSTGRLITRIVKVIMSTGRLTTRIVKVITSIGRMITPTVKVVSRTVRVITGTIRTGTCTERKANTIAHTFCSRSNHSLSQSSKISVQATATKIAMTGTYLPAWITRKTEGQPITLCCSQRG